MILDPTKRDCLADAPSLTARWLRFCGGLIALALFAGFFASGYSPPGAFGEVLRHNQKCDIDASPLLYSEVEHMAELEAGVERQRDQAKRSKKSPEGSLQTP